MKLLLTGATGFLGFRTLETLVFQPGITQILATGRRIKPSQHVDHPMVRYQVGDLTDTAFVDALVKDVDQIVHAAALSSPWGPRSAFVAANVSTQQHLIAAAQRYGVKRYIFISTPSMYFDMRDRLNVKESDPLPTPFINDYAATKRQAEILLEQSGLPYIILRPRALIGRGDTVIMPRLIRAYEAGRLKMIGQGNNIADLTPVANVADAIYLSLVANEQALNQTYNISNGEPVHLWDSIAYVLIALGKEHQFQQIPFWLAKALAQLLELKSRLTDQQEPVLTRYAVGTLAKSLTMDISKAQQLLGYRPKVSVKEAIDEFAAWYKTR